MLLLKILNRSLFSNKQQNIKTFRYDCKLVDRNCPQYNMCPVYGKLTIITKEGSAKTVNYIIIGAGGLMLVHSYICHYSENALSSTL